MSEEKKEEGSLIWQQLRKLINVIDQLRDVGLQQYITLPRIAALGTQSSGKSSVLESIVGLDFLPRGDGVVTRRPLELRLNHITNEKQPPYAIFEEIKGTKFTNFSDVRKAIDDLTDKICGKSKNILDIPIVLNVYSPTCPDLTLVDLPGITRIPLKGSDQPENIEEVTKNMATKYCKDERTIILCVIPSNIDLTTSEALQLAQKLDPKGVRTIGVITKIDIMDKGTNCKDTLLGKTVSLRLGFVGVKNRCQQDILDNISVMKALEQEELYFARHPIYSRLPSGYAGTRCLSGKLTKVFYTHIKHSIPEIIKEVKTKKTEVDKKLQSLGDGIPESELGKMQLLWAMINEFINNFISYITGKVEIQSKEYKATKKLFGGSKIKSMLSGLYADFDGEKKIKEIMKKEYTDENIEMAVIAHEGESLPGFPSAEAFLYLIIPQLDKLRKPAIDLLEDIHHYLEDIAQQMLEKVFLLRFPALSNELLDCIKGEFAKCKQYTEYLIQSMLDSERGYLFTADPKYMKERTDLIPKTEDKSESKVSPYIKEMRLRLESYFSVVVRNVRDSIPKIIGHFLVKKSQDSLQMSLYSKIAEKKDSISQLLGESPEVAKDRRKYNDLNKVLGESLKILSRENELLTSLEGVDTELLNELIQEKKTVKKAAAKE
jgi:vacuolar protein sorting-associated protein 1